ncbi:Exodeoxyribonuclease VII large subunit [Candidatus Bealeia paramacronuclearis]|uniref:Exodeoxyribonuclease 7 large subunit n=1 Tax=Candidatus Bealeia paramacronuclearis TaxID=1921001 RepID=A0ABZ2C013_9PROT|nr:Exodeoxyribonuclease VII large subunit [Candidatus Bealeia paramacronuclearis]
MSLPDLLHNLPEFTVSSLSQALKRTVESSYSRVRLKGEISGLKQHSSGHVYFSLKDENAVMDAVCWRGTFSGLSIRPQDGMEIIATGKITTYPGRSKYQMVVESIELAGEGALLKLLEDLKRKLAQEGLFEEGRKKTIPLFPKIIGVVTSPTGAVIRDILHRLADRFPSHVILWPVLVQGEGAAEQIAAAVRGFQNQSQRPDVLIVGRGGGSLEDLWAFNEEIVVRAVADSQIPVISAVGHETDVTLVDFAADKRAPTPTAAAEFAVPVRQSLMEYLGQKESRMKAMLGMVLQHTTALLSGLSRGLLDPQTLIQDKTQRLDDWTERLIASPAPFFEKRQDYVRLLSARLSHPKSMTEMMGMNLEHLDSRLKPAYHNLLERLQTHLNSSGQLLASYSYEKTLERGFALVFDSEKQLAGRVTQVTPGQDLHIRFYDGEVLVTPLDKHP